jgi:hypothetical protein
MYYHPSEVICSRSGRPMPDAPDTPILRAAAEHGWRVISYADDGSGCVEIVPGIELEIINDKFSEEDEDDYVVALGFHVKNLPRCSSDLIDGMMLGLQMVAEKLLDATDEEGAEVQRIGSTGAEPGSG